MNCAIIIPALNPEEKFIDIVKGLSPSENKPLIVVNDGSRQELLFIFDRIAKIPFCTVLHQEQNKGKGTALKTAFEYYSKKYTHLDGVVTADCDGQHRVEDITKIGKEVSKHKDSIILGARDFSCKGIPFKSWFGNKISSLIFKWLYGIKLADMQTGLRGVPSGLIKWLLSLKGERFEFEMHMLTEGSRKGIRIISYPIETIYINNNAGTHYRPLSDSVLVGKILFSGVVNYLASSAISAAADVSIFVILNTVAFRHMPLHYRLLYATVIARFISSVVNYYYNHNSVFNSGDYTKSAPRYYILWAAQLLLSYELTLFFTYGTHINSNISKIIIDLFLAIASYQVQMKWVFKNKNPIKELE